MNRPLLLAATMSLAACAADVYPVDGRMDLPPCERGLPRSQDCTVTGPAMAIDMMTRPPDPRTQPNASYQYRRYECERDRGRSAVWARPFC
jgi:hypothetical protein